jgi:hypothetical protein
MLYLINELQMNFFHTIKVLDQMYNIFQIHQVIIIQFYYRDKYRGIKILIDFDLFYLVLCEVNNQLIIQNE